MCEVEVDKVFRVQQKVIPSKHNCWNNYIHATIKIYVQCTCTYIGAKPSTEMFTDGYRNGKLSTPIPAL